MYRCNTFRLFEILSRESTVRTEFSEACRSLVGRKLAPARESIICAYFLHLTDCRPLDQSAGLKRESSNEPPKDLTY